MNDLTNPDDAAFEGDDQQAPSPPEAEPSQTHDARGPRRQGRARRSAGRSLPTRDDIIRALHSLPRLIALGILSPSEANAIRAALDSTLRALDRGQPTSSAGRTPPIDRLRELAEAFPEVIDILEPLLGDEVVDQIFDRPDNQDEGHADGSNT